MLLKVNSIFYSIQGEGFNTGLPVIFIRFAGCNRNCSFCDTDHDDYEEMEEKGIISAVKDYSCKNIILTGGEPTIQDIWFLTATFRGMGYWIGLETNGTNELQTTFDWVTISPKPGWILKRADELKVLYDGKRLDIYNGIRVKYKYLQPIDKGESSNIEHTIIAVKRLALEGWRLSVQLHKLIGVR